MSRSRRNSNKQAVFYPNPEIFLGWELDVYKDFIEFNENNIQFETAKLQEKYNDFEKQRSLGNMHPQLEDVLLDDFITGFDRLEHDYIKNYRSSQLILLYSFLEIKLKNGCDNYKVANNCIYGLRDLSGNGDFEKVKKFLTKTMKIKIEDLQPEWSFLDSFRKLRNIIVHSGGIAKNSNNHLKTLKSFAKDRYEILEDENETNFVLHNSKFLLEIIDNIQGLFNKINKLEIQIIESS